MEEARTTALTRTRRSKFRCRFFDRQTRLFDQPPECAGFDRTVLRHDNRTRAAPRNTMGPRLAYFCETKATQSTHGLMAHDIPRQLHSTDSTGSSTKCKRRDAGRSLSVK